MKARLEKDKQRIEKEQETERMKILTAANMSEQEMQRKMRELENKNKKLEAERANQLDLIGKLKNMEEKMLRGNEMMAKALEQEQHLHKAQVELDERKREELRKRNDGEGIGARATLTQSSGRTRRAQAQGAADSEHLARAGERAEGAQREVHVPGRPSSE